MYTKDGEYLGIYSNNEDIAPITANEDDFGLDGYEPDFFLPAGSWIENGSYEVSLKFDISDFKGTYVYSTNNDTTQESRDDFC